jgi:cell wall-associated NlpC family hydrolase
MQWALVALVLDSGGRELGRLLTALAVVVLLALLLAVSAPVLLIAGASAATASAPVAPPSPSAPAAPTPAAAVLPAPAGSAPVDIARTYLGVPYVFGGSDPTVGLDCSSLVQLVFRKLGIALPRTAQLQYEATLRVPRDELQPGDLVFFARTYADPHDWVTHVGIYLGQGMQINAPTAGQVVSIQPVFSGFWGAHFASGGRVRGAL